MRDRQDGRHVSRLGGELREVDVALEAWARWARSALAGLGWPPWTLAARVIEFGVLGAAVQYGSARALEVDELCELVESAVMRLKEIERKVVVYHYFNWQPVEASARYCHMMPGRFRVILHRARKSVADYLDGAKLRYNKIANTV